MINEELITERKTVILNELENLREGIASMEEQRIQMQANKNAMLGAIQQCDYFLGILNVEKSVDKGEKSNG